MKIGGSVVSAANCNTEGPLLATALSGYLSPLSKAVYSDTAPLPEKPMAYLGEKCWLNSKKKLWTCGPTTGPQKSKAPIKNA